jgi:hypothetical protein
MNGGGHLISINSKRIEMGNRQIFELKGLRTLKKSKNNKSSLHLQKFREF